MGKRYLIVSDLHLCDVEDHGDGWRAFKGTRYLFDDQLEELTASFVAQAGPGARLTLILNGDIFDFDLVSAIPDDAPFPVTPVERVQGLHPTEPKSVWKLERILGHHPRFVQTLARFLAAGHQVVYIVGNHDRELHFDGVRAALLAAVARAGASEGLAALDTERIRFEDWFYYVPGELYVEHGNQYDHYSSYPHVLAPTLRRHGEDEIAIPMGNLTLRYLGSGLGYFNPHGGDFILSLFGYLAHWFKYYAFSRRSLIVTWFLGSLRVLGTLLEQKSRAGRAARAHAAALAEKARRDGLPLETVLALDRLQRPPIASQLFRVIHEFWIDRLALAVAMVALTITLALAAVPLWLKLMVPFSALPLLYFIYDALVRGDTLFSVEKEVPRYAEQIARRLGVRVVSFGHTHIPQLVPLARGRVFVNSGTWAPIMRTTEDRRLAPGYRNYVVVTLVGGEAQVTLDSWLPGDAPAAESAPAAQPGLAVQQAAS